MSVLKRQVLALADVAQWIEYRPKKAGTVPIPYGTLGMETLPVLKEEYKRALHFNNKKIFLKILLTYF